jgi:hypothetical protein
MDSSSSMRRTTRSTQHAGLAENLMSITRGLVTPQTSAPRASPQLSDFVLPLETQDLPDADPTLPVVIVMGNPGVSQSCPYPTRQKPIPAPRVRVFEG